MKWTIKHKSNLAKTVNFGDKQILERFCFLPRVYHSDLHNTTTFYWLEKVYLVYEYVQGHKVTRGLRTYIEDDHWKRIGLATSYSRAVQEIWG